VQHRLDGITADVEAGAAERLAAPMQGGFQAQLRPPGSPRHSRGAGADYQKVIVNIVGHIPTSLVPSSRTCFGTSKDPERVQE